MNTVWDVRIYTLDISNSIIVTDNNMEYCRAAVSAYQYSGCQFVIKLISVHVKIKVSRIQLETQFRDFDVSVCKDNEFAWNQKH